MKRGFTIVELLIVIVVIAILAAITIVAYNGIRQRADVAALDTAVAQQYRKIETEKIKNGDQYPVDLAAAGIISPDSNGISYDYRVFSYGFCISGQNAAGTYHVSTDNPSPTFGSCGQVKAEYFNNTTFSGNPVVTKYEDNITKIWGTASPDPAVNADNFTSRFTTYIIPPVTASYTFSTLADDVEKITINGSVVFDNLGGAMGSCCTLRNLAPISLTAGVPVSVIYEQREGGGGAYAQLQWAYGSVARTPVPTSVFVRRP